MGLKDVLSDEVARCLNSQYSSMLIAAPKVQTSQNSLKTTPKDNLQEIHLKLKTKARFIDLFAATCSMTGLLIALVEYEDYCSTDGKQYFTISEKGNVLRGIITALTCIQIVALFFYSRIKFRLWDDSNFYQAKVAYLASPYIKTFLLETLIAVVHPLPGLEVNFLITQLNRTFLFNINGFILCIMLLRTYILIRLATEYSKFTSSLAERVCYRGGTEANMSFALKSMIKEKPYLSIMSLMTASVVLFGIAVRIFERPVYFGESPESISYQNYEDYVNSMWLVIIAMATIGFGDYYPRTHFGRLVILLACFWGVFLVSLIVSNLTISSSFITKESKAYDILYRLDQKNKIREKAARLVALSIELVSYQKKLSKKKLTPKFYLEKKIKTRLEMTQALEEFRKAKAKLPDFEIGAEELLRQLTEKINKDIDEITNLLNYIVTLEDQINQITHKQSNVCKILSVALQFSKNLENEIMEFKRSLNSKVK